jgi:(p)ppGpp synthase/HD superfamily hydrolase
MIEKAIQKASVLHKGQLRKAEQIPYVSHLYSVAWILSEYTQDEDLIVAAFLHDSVEDVKGYTFENIQQDFGSRVRDIVASVTEEKILKVWEERKKKYLQNIQKSSQEALRRR